jgi:hypothetical protein
MLLPILLFILSGFGNYKTAYERYTLARSQFAQYHTTSTRQNAISQTGKVLKARNQLILEYLRLLRQRFADTTQVGNYAQNVIYLDLETQINWFVNWEKKIDGLESPQELNTASDNWQNYWSSVLEKVKAAKKEIARFRLERFQLQAEGLDYASTSASLKSLINSKFEQSRATRIAGNIETSRELLIAAVKAIYESTQK